MEVLLVLTAVLAAICLRLFFHQRKLKAAIDLHIRGYQEQAKILAHVRTTADKRIKELIALEQNNAELKRQLDMYADPIAKVTAVPSTSTEPITSFPPPKARRKTRYSTKPDNS